MNTTPDLVVIGAGLAGLMAAHTAARAGLKVRLIAKGLGAIHWSAGTIDVLGYLPAANSEAVKFPLKQIEKLVEMAPDHPYGRVGPHLLAEAMDRFVTLTQSLALPYHGASVSGQNLLLPSPVGAARPAYLAPAAQLAGDLSRPEPIHVVGFKGLRDFYPQLIAENLRKQGYSARASFLPLNLISRRRDSNMVQLAQALDSPERADALAGALKPLVEPHERVGLPALLGLARHNDVMARLEALVGVPIFEIPTLPPSVPGVRLFRAWRRSLESMGVQIEIGMEAIGFSSDESDAAAHPIQVRWVETETSARPLKHRARHFLLATGGILGGGFDSDHQGRVWETVFDLPLTTPQERSHWFRLTFLDPAGHPVFRGGVPVAADFQPVDASGQKIFANLWVAGGALAGVDPIRERSLEGIAIATGLAAAQAILATTGSKTHVH